MTKGILGRKVGMTQIYSESGKVIPVTVIQAGPCHVLQIRTRERDGYEAVQLGFPDKPRRLARRSERGHVAKLSSKRSRKRAAAGVQLPPKADCEPKRFVREFRGPVDGYQVGQAVTVEVFRPVLDELPAMLRELAGKSKVDHSKPGWEDQLRRKKPEDYRKLVASISDRRCHGHQQGARLRGRDQAAPFLGPAGDARCEESAPARRQRGGQCRSASRVQGDAHGRPVGGRPGDDPQSARGADGHRANNLLLVRGAVPGPNGGYVMIRETNNV